MFKGSVCRCFRTFSNSTLHFQGGWQAGKQQRQPGAWKRFASNTPAQRRPSLPSARAAGTVLFTLGLFLGLQPAPRIKNQGTSIGGTTQVIKTENAVELPRRYRLSEVQQHDGQSEHPWIIKATSVYDITDWVAAHPGGEVILRAAGGSLEPYWDIFAIHKRQDVYEILEQYKIGEIDESDLVDGKVPLEAIEDPFISDPARDPRLRTLTTRPRNAETPEDGLAEFITPTDLFYVRNHMWVPVVDDGSSHRVTVELQDGDEKVYTVKDLKEKFQTYTVTATLQCAGNRRKDMTNHAKKTNGLQWAAGAVSTAEWEGIKLRDLLADVGLNLDKLPADAKHIHFAGLEAYAASIPTAKAVDPLGDVLLAFRMNGKELPRDHGFPIRVIVPGNVAARSVKWLRKITISDEESPSQWQRRDYKTFCPSAGPNPDWSKAKSIQEMPVTSAISKLSTQRKQQQHPDDQTGVVSSNTTVYAEGYAYSGGGREIVRVDVSADGGKTWEPAALVDDTSRGNKSWCWKRWRYSGAIKEGNNVGKISLVVKATDEAYNTQPESYESIYNVRGNLATAWHRVDVKSVEASAS